MCVACHSVSFEILNSSDSRTQPHNRRRIPLYPENLRNVVDIPAESRRCAQPSEKLKEPENRQVGEITPTRCKISELPVGGNKAVMDRQPVASALFPNRENSDCGEPALRLRLALSADWGWAYGQSKPLASRSGRWEQPWGDTARAEFQRSPLTVEWEKQEASRADPQHLAQGRGSFGPQWIPESRFTEKQYEGGWDSVGKMPNHEASRCGLQRQAAFDGRWQQQGVMTPSCIRLGPLIEDLQWFRQGIHENKSRQSEAQRTQGGPYNQRHRLEGIKHSANGFGGGFSEKNQTGQGFEHGSSQNLQPVAVVPQGPLNIGKFLQKFCCEMSGRRIWVQHGFRPFAETDEGSACL